MSKTRRDAGNDLEEEATTGKPVQVDSAVADENTEQPTEAPPPSNIFSTIYELKKNDLEAAFSQIKEEIRALIDHSGLQTRYNFSFLYDDRTSISERTSNKLYAAASGDFADRSKLHLLLIHTKGGAPVPAYLISRYLKTSSTGGFVAVIPRKAKSAGTLLALGAQEIHMGMMSELGPIDPQFSDLPALGLGSALDHIAGTCEKHPGAAEMLAKYLQTNLNIHHLGLFERVSESATHYAEKLLTRPTMPAERSAEIAKHLVYGYKDHSFAIDCDEIRTILGPDIVKIETPEYLLANRIHQYMESVNLAYWAFHDKFCAIVGSLDDLVLSDRED